MLRSGGQDPGQTPSTAPYRSGEVTAGSPQVEGGADSHTESLMIS